MAETATAAGLVEDREGDLGGDRDGRPTVPSGVALLAVGECVHGIVSQAFFHNQTQQLRS